MQVQDIMTRNPSCCTPETSLSEVVKLMIDCDCGEIPVIDGSSTPIGVVTDRDIACRSIGLGKNPLQLKARDVMTSPVFTVPPEVDVEECCKVMAHAQIRRVPVVDHTGRCCGIVSEADIARRASESETAHVVKDISQPGHGWSGGRNLVS